MEVKTRTRSRHTFAQVDTSRKVEYRYDYKDGYGWRPWSKSSAWTYQVTTPYNPLSSGCEDVANGYGKDNPLTIIHTSTKLGNLDASWFEEEEFPDPYGYLQQSRGSIDEVLVSHPYGMEEGVNEERIEFVTKAAADTNPSKAKVDVAVFIGELRDLPSLFKNVGDDMFKYGANEYLKAQYGWKPLIKDLRNFFKVVNLVDKRMRNLERLNKDKLLRLPYRNKNPLVTVGSNTLFHKSTPMFPGWRAELKTETTWRRSRWATVSFKPEVPKNLVTLPSKDMLSKVNQALYGGVVDGATLWQLMPWSWLYDWSSNVGDFLAANRNVVGAKVDDVTLMETNEILSTTDVVGWYSEGGINRPSSAQTPAATQMVQKLRFPNMKPAVITRGDIDVMSDTFKMPILTALAIQRFKK